MKKLLLATLICFYSAPAWNPFEKKESTARKVYNKARELVSPFAPLGMQIVGGVVVPTVIACAANPYKGEPADLVIVGAVFASTAASTAYNGYQVHQSNKGKKQYNKSAIAYAVANEVAILGIMYCWHKIRNS